MTVDGTHRAQPTLGTLDDELARVPGVASVWFGPPGGPARFARAQHHTHYAASTMKVAVLAATHRRAEAGQLDLAEEVPVRNEFASAAEGAPTFGCQREDDNDEAVWQRVGSSVPLGWLAERMIVASSNLATNIVLSRVGLDAVAQVWQAVGEASQTRPLSVVSRGIEDAAAAKAGLTNLVTAADLAALFGTIERGARAPGPLASPTSCQKMLDVLLAQEHTEDLAAGLPPGTSVAHKNGWILGVRHSAGVVLAAPGSQSGPLVIAVCLTTPLAVNEPGDEACQLVARIARLAYRTHLRSDF